MNPSLGLHAWPLGYSSVNMRPFTPVHAYSGSVFRRPALINSGTKLITSTPPGHVHHPLRARAGLRACRKHDRAQPGIINTLLPFICSRLGHGGWGARQTGIIHGTSVRAFSLVYNGPPGQSSFTDTGNFIGKAHLELAGGPMRIRTVGNDPLKFGRSSI